MSQASLPLRAELDAAQTNVRCWREKSEAYSHRIGEMEAELAKAREITSAKIERARLAGARWFAEHDDGASSEDEWRDFHRAALEAALGQKGEPSMQNHASSDQALGQEGDGNG